MNRWKCVLELNSKRQIVAGSEKQLLKTIANGADLRIYTEFLHNQHIDVTSDSDERILEVAEFAVTYVINDCWASGIMSLRQPIELPVGFGPRPSMSFFLYNQDASQAIARLFLDGRIVAGKPGASPLSRPENMPKYHTLDNFDSGTNSPSQNFIYDFDIFRYDVGDCWREVLAHDEQGKVKSGSLKDLIDCFSSGCEIKVGIKGLCDELRANKDEEILSHEVFVQAGPGYYYTEQKLFIAGSHPVVRVSPNIPMRYKSNNWDFGWIMARTDGRIVYRRCDPYTLKFNDITLNKAVRWFVR